jgi:cytochrome c oxidase cbb3-type subunit III
VTLALVVLFCAVVAFCAVRTNSMRDRLLRAAPDSIPANRELLNYALRIGQHVYERHCQSCHGGQLRADAREGVPNLSDREWLYGSGTVLEIERVVLYGIRSGLPKTWNLADMPAFARPNPYRRYRIEPLSPGEIDDLASFVLSFQDSKQDPVAVTRGAALFHNPQRGLCFDCHAQDARGDNAIGAPDLTDRVWLYGNGSRKTVRESIEYGHAGVCPGWKDRLTPAEIRSVAVYVHSTKVSKGR